MPLGLCVATLFYGIVHVIVYMNTMPQESCGRVAARLATFVTGGLVAPGKATREAEDREAAARPVHAYLRRAGGPAEEPGEDPGVTTDAFFAHDAPQSALYAWAAAAYPGGLGDEYVLRTEHLMQRYAIVKRNSDPPLSRLVTPFGDQLSVRFQIGDALPPMDL